MITYNSSAVIQEAENSPVEETHRNVAKARCELPMCILVLENDNVVKPEEVMHWERKQVYGEGTAPSSFSVYSQELDQDRKKDIQSIK